MKRDCLCVFVAALLASPAVAQQANGLQLVVMAGDGAVNDITAGTAVEPAVEVRGPDGQPVAGAKVAFAAPLEGPSVSFYGSMSRLTVTTDENGLARATTTVPNTEPGEFAIQIAAEAEGRRGALEISQTNANPREPLPVEKKNRFGWKVWSAIGAAAVVAVVAAVIRSD